MNTVTVSEFEKEMDEIDRLQDVVSEWCMSKSIFRFLWSRKARKAHFEAGRRMTVLFSKELIED